jgi:hypothetical protein
MRRIPRTKGAFSGFLIVLLGIWGALIPFVGPYFNYAMHSTDTWQWFSDRFWLEVLPGIVTVVGGLILMRGATRASTSFGALIALAGGLWFVVGPQLSILWNHGVIVVGPPMGAHNITRALEWIGFFYGVGALIVMFSSYALGFMAALPIVDERVVGRTVATGAGTGAAAGFAAGRASKRREREPVAQGTAPAAGTAAADEPTVADRRAAADEPTVANRTAADDPTVADRTAEAPAATTERRRTGGLFRRRRRETTRT